VPGAELPERVVHLYACAGLSTYRVGEIVQISRQRVARMLHRSGVPVTPKGAGRRRAQRVSTQLSGEVLADLYLDRRLTCAQISEVTGIPARTVRDRLVAAGIRLRTKGRLNREDRVAVEPDLLRDLYVRGGLSSQEIGSMLGLSRRVVLRAAHDEGVPVRVGGPAPDQGPEDIQLIDALYADEEVRQTLDRFELPKVPAGGSIWQRFPAPIRLSAELAAELYEKCGLATTHIELLTGQPAATVSRLLTAAGVSLRAPGGRSPFMRRWREVASG